MRALDSKPAKKRPEKEQRAEQKGPMKKGLEVELSQRGKIPRAASPWAAQKRMGALAAPKRTVAAKYPSSLAASFKNLM